MSPRYIFLDLETTGLEAGVDQITEAAWILDNGIERHFFVEHRMRPNKWVAECTDYRTRIAPAAKVPLANVMRRLEDDCAGINAFLVGACPAFDDRFLRHAFRDEVPYNYHVLDVEAMAIGALGLTQPPRLKDLRAALGIPGENEAAHTALSDAREVKLIFEAIMALPKRFEVQS